MRSVLLITLALCISLPAHAARIKTCTCGPKHTIERESKRAFAVFTGTVTEVDIGIGLNKKTKVKFNVHQSWKGARHETISVWAAGKDLYSKAKETFMCHYQFEKGKTYFVVSHRKKNKRGLTTVSTCGNTAPYESAGLQRLKMGEPTLKNEAPEGKNHAVER